jgi:hypothetical protein
MKKCAENELNEKIRYFILTLVKGLYAEILKGLIAVSVFFGGIV